MLVRKFSKLCDDVDQFFLDQFQGFCHYDDIRVVAHITGGCTQMDDSFCLWTLYPICIYVGHNIVTDLFFPLFCYIIVDVIHMGFQLVDLFLGDI